MELLSNKIYADLVFKTECENKVVYTAGQNTQNSSSSNTGNSSENQNESNGNSDN